MCITNIMVSAGWSKGQATSRPFGSAPRNAQQAPLSTCILDSASGMTIWSTQK